MGVSPSLYDSSSCWWVLVCSCSSPFDVHLPFLTTLGTASSLSRVWDPDLTCHSFYNCSIKSLQDILNWGQFWSPWEFGDLWRCFWSSWQKGGGEREVFYHWLSLELLIQVGNKKVTKWVLPWFCIFLWPMHPFLACTQSWPHPSFCPWLTNDDRRLAQRGKWSQRTSNYGNYW